MKNSAIKIFKKNKNRILENWIEIQLQDVGLQEHLISNEEIRAQSEELVNSFINSLNDDNIDKFGSLAYEPIVDVLSAISISRAKQGFSPRETGVYIFSLKDALLKELQMAISDPRELYEQSLKIIKVIDSFGAATFEAFIQGREDVIRRQTGEMDEISTPVIKVWDGILALPIIGTLDSARTQTVMENLLIQIVETGSEVAILDISGVPTVDSLVAQHLIKTVSATRLMGAECIISGIRPEIAQTIVHLGIDLSSITTKATLASALKTAFNMLSLKVEKKVHPSR
ncbi:MAG: STAS domain-containing protein [Chryseolinea sp.]